MSLKEIIREKYTLRMIESNDPYISEDREKISLRKSVATLSGKFPERSSVKTKGGKRGTVLSVGKDYVKVAHGNRQKDYHPSQLTREESEALKGPIEESYKKKYETAPEGVKAVADHMAMLKKQPTDTLKRMANQHYKVHSANSKNELVGMLMRAKFGKKKLEAHDSHFQTEQKQGVAEEYTLQERINMAKAKMGDVIKDFYKSDAPQFKGKSKEKRREMAIAAKLEADRDVQEALKPGWMLNDPENALMQKYGGKTGPEIEKMKEEMAVASRSSLQLGEVHEGESIPVEVLKSPYDGAEAGEYTTHFVGSPNSAQRFAKYVKSKGGKVRIGKRGSTHFVFHNTLVSKEEARKAQQIDEKSHTISVSEIRGMKTHVDLSSLQEELKGDQHKIDKNKNGKIDSHDFKLLRLNPGDKVHVGHTQPGGSGMSGTVHKIEGDEVHVKVGSGKFGDRIVKGKLKNATLQKEDYLAVDIQEKKTHTMSVSDMKGMKDVEKIANKHNVSKGHILNQLKIGKKVETEHTGSKRGVIDIALDHLDELPDYYTRLAKMEKKGNLQKEDRSVVDRILEARKKVSEKSKKKTATGQPITTIDTKPEIDSVGNAGNFRKP